MATGVPFTREEGDMSAKPISVWRKSWQLVSSIKTGVILLIVVVIVSAAGTLILQRPMTDPDEMQRAYSPQALRILDAVGLTNVFHAWWFLTLLLLVSLSIIAASIERFPNAWRFYARPYKITDESFRRALAIQRQQSALAALARRREQRNHQRLHLPAGGVEFAQPFGERGVVLRGEQHRGQHEIGHAAGEQREGGLDGLDGEQLRVAQRAADDRAEPAGLAPIGLDGQDQKHLTSAS